MRILQPPLPVLTVAAIVAMLASPAWAQRGSDNTRAQDRRELRGMGEERGSLSESVRRVQRGTSGQVLGAERVPYDGHEVHRVKVLDERGRVRVFMDDPRTDRDDPSMDSRRMDGPRGDRGRGRDADRRDAWPTRDDDD